MHCTFPPNSGQPTCQAGICWEFPMSCVWKGLICFKNKEFKHKYQSDLWINFGILPHPVTSNGRNKLGLSGSTSHTGDFGHMPGGRHRRHGHANSRFKRHMKMSTVLATWQRNGSNVGSSTPTSRGSWLTERTLLQQCTCTYSQRGFLIFNRCCHYSCQKDVHPWYLCTNHA